MLLAQVWVWWMGPDISGVTDTSSLWVKLNLANILRGDFLKGWASLCWWLPSHSTHLQKYPGSEGDNWYAVDFHRARKRKYLLFQTFPCTAWIGTYIFNAHHLVFLLKLLEVFCLNLGIFCAWHCGEYVDLSWLLGIVYKILLVCLQNGNWNPWKHEIDFQVRFEPGSELQ